MAEDSARFRFPMEDSKPLRCELCGEQIGVTLSTDAGRAEDNPNVILRCFQCGAVEAAEAILEDTP